MLLWSILTTTKLLTDQFGVGSIQCERNFLRNGLDVVPDHFLLLFLVLLVLFDYLLVELHRGTPGDDRVGWLCG